MRQRISGSRKMKRSTKMDEIGLIRKSKERDEWGPKETSTKVVEDEDTIGEQRLQRAQGHRRLLAK